MPYQSNMVVNLRAPLAEADIVALEKRIGEVLPSELRRHYLEYNGGQLTKREFLAKIGDQFHLHEFLPVFPGKNRGFELAFDVARRDPGFMPADLLPFGIDEGGAYFCIRRADEHVVFFNPENANNIDWAISEVALSLHDFIEGMF